MTNILGISAFYHDSAASLVVDGEIVAAAQEERFTRQKHDSRFPEKAIQYCLEVAGLQPEDLDHVGFYEKPLTKFERLLETYLAFVPSGYRSFRQAIPMWIRQKLHLPREMRRGLKDRYKGRFVFTDHHQSHAASAFFPSPFDEAAILTLDGVGEWSSTCLGEGRGNALRLLQEMQFPHSLGLLYSAFTYYLGFRVNSGEYKVMGLAPYGKPMFKQQILEHLIDLKADGSFRLDMRYFNYCQGLTMTSDKFHRLFGGPPRHPESPISQREMDIAASIQAIAEEVLLRIGRYVHQQTGMKKLVLAGGVALNCVANGRLLREGPFEDIWIQPAAGDAGGSLGTALYIWHQLLNKPRPTRQMDSQKGSLLGPAFSDDEIVATLKRNKATFTSCASEKELCERVSALIAQENVVGWFQGRMEFGPRALGNRSILGDARSKAMQSVMNQRIKFRESFRPFAPIVLREYADQYFELQANQESPYMLLVAPVHPHMRLPPTPTFHEATGFDRLSESRSIVPAITHVDYSARIQTVDQIRNPLLHALLTQFHELTGCPMMVNTSFNVRGEPMVCTPEEALRGFMMTDMDALVMGRQILMKTEQTENVTGKSREEHLAQFRLD